MAMLSAFFMPLDIASNTMKWFGLSLNVLLEEIILWGWKVIWSVGWYPFYLHYFFDY
jgi:hypothetical protein